MPYSLVDHALIPINLRLDRDVVNTQDKLVSTLRHMQDEINRQNDTLLKLIIEAFSDISELLIYDPSTGYTAIIELKPGIMGADVTFQLLDNSEGLSETDLRIPVMNHATIKQNWSGQQSFNNSTPGEGTKINLLRTGKIRAKTSGGIIEIGDVDGLDSDDNSYLGFNATISISLTTLNGESVFDGSSVDFQERTSGPTPVTSHGAYWIKQGAENWPMFTSGVQIDYKLAGLERVQAWTADQEFQGDLFYSGAGSGIPYGACQGMEIAWTQANAVQNQWYNISDADFVTTQLNEITHDGNGQLTVLKDGMYSADWAGAFEADAAGVHIQITFSVNGTATDFGMNHFKTIAVLREFPISAPTILSLEAGDTVNVALRTSDAGTPDLLVDHLLIRLTMLGGI